MSCRALCRATQVSRIVHHVCLGVGSLIRFISALVADTRYYWNMTKHIFRYNHQNGGNSGQLPSGVHTVNECERFRLMATFGADYRCSHLHRCIRRDDKVFYDPHSER